jgi:hypothetical protein
VSGNEIAPARLRARALWRQGRRSRGRDGFQRCRTAGSTIDYDHLIAHGPRTGSAASCSTPWCGTWPAGWNADQIADELARHPDGIGANMPIASMPK